MYREGIIPFARRNYDIGPDSLSTLEAQQKWLQQLKKKLITWKQYKKLAGVSSSSSVSARRKKEQIVSTLESDAGERSWAASTESDKGFALFSTQLFVVDQSPIGLIVFQYTHLQPGCILALSFCSRTYRVPK